MKLIFKKGEELNEEIDFSSNAMSSEQIDYLKAKYDNLPILRCEIEFVEGTTVGQTHSVNPAVMKKLTVILG